MSGAAQLDATLVPTGYGRVFGTVVDADGDPVAGVSVDFPYNSGMTATTGDAGGSFRWRSRRSSTACCGSRAARRRRAGRCSPT